MLLAFCFFLVGGSQRAGDREIGDIRGWSGLSRNRVARGSFTSYEPLPLPPPLPRRRRSGRRVWRDVRAGAVVCGAAEAFLDGARMGVRASLDSALCAHRGGRMAGLARCGHGRNTRRVDCATRV